MMPTFQWSGVGQVLELRELKSKEGKVFAYSAKVAAMGGTFELQTRDPLVHQSIPAGGLIECCGDFELYNGNLRLAVRMAKPYAPRGTAGGSQPAPAASAKVA